jgi:hypothetical protein
MTLRALTACLLFVIATITIAQAPARPREKTVTTAGAPATDTATALRQIQRDIAALRQREPKRATDPDVFLPFVATLVVALGGWTIAWWLATRSHRRESAERAEDRLVESLILFTKGSQARSVALGLVEAYWERLPWMQPAWANVLSNQAIHILTSSDERASLVEKDNAQRIFGVLARQVHKKAGTACDLLLSDYQRGALLAAVSFALEPAANKTGVEVPQLARHWWLRLSGIPRNEWPDYLEGRKPIVPRAPLFG